MKNKEENTIKEVLLLSRADKTTTSELYTEPMLLIHILESLSFELLSNLSQIYYLRDNYGLQAKDILKMSKKYKLESTNSNKAPVIKKLLASLIITTNSKQESNKLLNEIKNHYVHYSYPLFSAETGIISILRKCPVVKGHICYTRYDKIKIPETVKNIEDNEEFFYLAEKLTSLISEQKDDYASYLSELNSPGFYLNGKNNLFKNEHYWDVDSRYLFIGDYESDIKWKIWDHTTKFSKYYEYDLREGLPKHISSGYEILVFKNLHTLYSYEVSELIIIINKYGYGKAPVYLHSKYYMEHLCFKEFKIVRETDPENYYQNISAIFLKWIAHYYNFQGLVYTSIIENNSYLGLLNYVQGTEVLHYTISELNENIFNMENNEADKLVFTIGHFTLGFWYYLYESYMYNEAAIEEQIDLPDEDELKYLWIYRGDYWEISFGYEKPILVKDIKGLYYFAHFFANPNVKIHVSDFRYVIVGEKKEKNSDENLDKSSKEYKKVKRREETSSMKLIKVNMTDLIKKIAEIEQKLGIEKNLSSYLLNIKFNYMELSDSSSEVRFLPDENVNIKWTLSTPKYSGV